MCKMLRLHNLRRNYWPLKRQNQARLFLPLLWRGYNWLFAQGDNVLHDWGHSHIGVARPLWSRFLHALSLSKSRKTCESKFKVAHYPKSQWLCKLSSNIKSEIRLKIIALSMEGIVTGLMSEEEGLQYRIVYWWKNKNVATEAAPLPNNAITRYFWKPGFSPEAERYFARHDPSNKKNRTVIRFFTKNGRVVLLFEKDRVK